MGRASTKPFVHVPSQGAVCPARTEVNTTCEMKGVNSYQVNPSMIRRVLMNPLEDLPNTGKEAKKHTFLILAACARWECVRAAAAMMTPIVSP